MKVTQLLLSDLFLVSQGYTANKSQIINNKQIKKSEAEIVPTFASPKDSVSNEHRQYGFQSADSPIKSKSKFQLTYVE